MGHGTLTIQQTITFAHGGLNIDAQKQREVMAEKPFLKNDSYKISNTFYLHFQILYAQLALVPLGDFTAEPHCFAFLDAFGGGFQQKLDGLVIVDASSTSHYVAQTIHCVDFTVFVGRSRVSYQTYLRNYVYYSYSYWKILWRNRRRPALTTIERVVSYQLELLRV